MTFACRLSLNIAASDPVSATTRNKHSDFEGINSSVIELRVNINA